MRYLPILQELTESDTVIFLIIGLIAAVIAGLWQRHPGRCVKGIIEFAVLYAVCELLSQVHTNFMAELLLLFIGTAAIGGCAGFLIAAVVWRIRALRGAKG